MKVTIRNQDACTPLSIYDDVLRVDWYDADEGLCGDYNPEDPNDVHLLRFDVYYREGEYEDWVEVEDASYCTQMPIDTNHEILERALNVIFKEYRNVISDYPYTSVKKLGESLSWISPNDFKEA